REQHHSRFAIIGPAFGKYFVPNVFRICQYHLRKSPKLLLLSRQLPLFSGGSLLRRLGPALGALTTAEKLDDKKSNGYHSPSGSQFGACGFSPAVINIRTSPSAFPFHTLCFSFKFMNYCSSI